jgi:hypothetical protein
MGDAPRRKEVPAMVYPYSSGIVGGLIAGMAMVVVALIYGLLTGRGIWYPVNLIGATVLRDLQNAPQETFEQFNLAALIAGLVIHLIMSAGLGFVFSLVLPTLPGSPWVWAAIVAPLLWITATALALPLLNPIMERYIDWPSFGIAQFFYSLILGWWLTRTPKVPASGPLTSE